MQNHKIPSLFKLKKNKDFNFQNRYYNEKKERSRNINKDKNQAKRFNFKQRNLEIIKMKKKNNIVIIST